MASTRTRAIAALVAVLGVAALGSPGFAQERQVAEAGQRGPHREHKQMEFRLSGSDGVYRLAGVACGPNATERLENRLERIADRLELTAEQTTLFETFRTTALTAQTGFADACKAALPERAADLGAAPGAPADKALEPNAMGKGAPPAGDMADRAGRPDRPERAGRMDRMDRMQHTDMIAGLESRIAIDKARITAVEAVLPDLKAFLASLTDAQKAKFMGPLERGFGPEFRRGHGGGLDG